MKELYNNPSGFRQFNNRADDMSVHVREATEDDRAEWNRYLEQSPYGSLFHRQEVIEVLAAHSGCQRHHLIGFKGEEPVGLFPIFELEKGPFTTVFSPPPDLRIPSQGPVLLNMAKLKQRKAERRHQSFLEGCVDWIDTELSPRYTHLRLDGTYPDLRPMKWQGFETSTAYTYLVDLTPDTEELLLSFSSDARRNIRNGSDAETLAIEVGDRDAIPQILTQVRNRYESQGIAFHPSDEFFLDLYDALPDGVLRPYVCRVDGNFVGGIIAYEFDETIYRWQGGVRTDADVDVSVNDMLDWAVMEDGKDRGCSTYDLVGANNPRINKYKAKFNPSLQETYTLERGSAVMNMAAQLYKQVRGSTVFK